MQRTSITALALAALLAGAAHAADELAIGAKAPDFTLPGVDGKELHLADLVAKHGDQDGAAAVAVVFTCNECPFAKAYEPVLLDLAKRYADENVQFVLVNSNDPKIVPGDSFEKMQARAKEKAYPFPYLYDATQATATAYGARVTPHVFLFDRKLELRYRGRVNDSKDPRGDAKTAENHDLVNAIDAVLAGKDVAVSDTKAFGCSIKWRKQS